ncbi:hypothetical protein PVAP13_8KG337604, partial [Panicum virgatum]
GAGGGGGRRLWPPPSLSPVCYVPFPALAPCRASPFSTRRLPRFAAWSSGGGGGSRPEPKPGDNGSKAILDAFFLGKAFTEALTERVESVVGEVFSIVGQWQAEQQKQVQEFQRGLDSGTRASEEADTTSTPHRMRSASLPSVTGRSRVRAPASAHLC